MNHKKKILVIEDEKPLLMAIKSKLESNGYEIVFAEDGALGEKMIKDEKPDLVLLDILLPKKDGFQILESLAKEKNDVPIVIISNSGQTIEVDRAKKLGAKDFLIKADFSPVEVLEKVEKIIGSGLSEVSKKEDKPQEESEPIKDAGTKSSAEGDTVLVVEDDEFLREVIVQKLVKEGFNVEQAIDSQGAFEILDKKNVKIILLDLILPGMDGYEIINKLKKESSTKDIPIIVLSNLGQQKDIDKALSVGVEDYLIKANFTPAEIVEKTRAILKKKYL